MSPVYQSESTVAELCGRIVATLEHAGFDYSIVLVDDGSTDSSWASIQKCAQEHGRVHGIRLGRNMGQHVAITAGLDYADADIVVIMDCDLQDPPEAIPQFIETLDRTHADVVVARYVSRTESRRRQLTSSAYWWLLSLVSGYRFDSHIGNFRAITRRTLDAIREYREQLRLLHGLTTLVGARTVEIPLQRAPRHSGDSSYNFRSLVRISLEYVVAYSSRPLHISISLGFITSALAFVGGLGVLVLWLSGNVQVEGWASVLIAIFFVGGLILGFLGIVGIYIGKTYDEARHRPLYHVWEHT